MGPIVDVWRIGVKGDRRIRGPKHGCRTGNFIPLWGFGPYKAEQEARMKVGDICTRDVVTVAPEATLEEAAKIMRQRQSGSLVVIRDEDGKTFPVGIVTDRDIVVEVVGKDLEDIAKISAGDLLDRELITATEEEGVLELVERMRAHGIRRVPVIGDDGTIIGIVSFDDVVGALSRILADLTVLVGRQQRREEKRRG
jgi:CBS domain-containing protein